MDDLYHILNDSYQVTVSRKGAEMKSILQFSTKREYLWNGNPEFWGRTSPVLFPIVGRLREDSYQYDGHTYCMKQHGFARDMNFEKLEHSENAILFRLLSNQDTYRQYPFSFALRIGYELNGNTINVLWEVENKDEKTMYFSIGAHPAFLCRLSTREKQKSCFLQFDTKKELTYSRLNPKNGLTEAYGLPLPAPEGLLPVTEDLFSQDALILEGSQVKKVSLLDSKKKPVVSLSFDAPLLGLWAPNKKDVPFLCLEPWYGRCDGEGFSGTLKDRPYTNVLEPGGLFQAEYHIELF